MDRALCARVAAPALAALVALACVAPSRAEVPHPGPQPSGVRNLIRYVGCAWGIYIAPNPRAMQSMILSCGSLLKFNLN